MVYGTNFGYSGSYLFFEKKKKKTTLYLIVFNGIQLIPKVKPVYHT